MMGWMCGKSVCLSGAGRSTGTRYGNVLTNFLARLSMKDQF